MQFVISEFVKIGRYIVLPSQLFFIISDHKISVENFMTLTTQLTSWMDWTMAFQFISYRLPQCITHLIRTNFIYILLYYAALRQHPHVFIIYILSVFTCSKGKHIFFSLAKCYLINYNKNSLQPFKWFIDRSPCCRNLMF